MRAAMIIAAIALVCFAGIGIWQLSEDGSDSGSSSEETAAPRETTDPLPPLPRGWTGTVNAAGGFAFGLPPGWSEESVLAKSTVRSPGSAVVVSITADRTNEAVEADLADYATGVAQGLEPDSAPAPLPEAPKPREAGYESAGVIAPRDGSSGSGGQLRVIVVRRIGIAAYPILIASGRGVKQAELEPIVDRLVRSLRGRPIAPLAG